METNACPKCNSPRIESDIECPKCGIIYSKYKSKKQGIDVENLIERESKASLIHKLKNNFKSQPNKTIILPIAIILITVTSFIFWDYFTIVYEHQSIKSDIKKHLNYYLKDPDSMKDLEWKEFWKRQDGVLTVHVRYRAKNSWGAYGISEEWYLKSESGKILGPFESFTGDLHLLANTIKASNLYPSMEHVDILAKILIESIHYEKMHNKQSP